MVLKTSTHIASGFFTIIDESVFYLRGFFEQEDGYKNLRRCGYWEFHYEDDTIHSQGNYEENKKIGMWKIFYPTGELKTITFHAKQK